MAVSGLLSGLLRVVLRGPFASHRKRPSIVLRPSPIASRYNERAAVAIPKGPLNERSARTRMHECIPGPYDLEYHVRTKRESGWRDSKGILCETQEHSSQDRKKRAVGPLDVR